MNILEKLANDTISKDVAKKDYNAIQQFTNVTSYSILTELHACPRRFQLIKARAIEGGEITNVDFAFGHAVGAGVSAFLASGSIEYACYQAFLAWNIEFAAAIDKKKKNIWSALLAVEKYRLFHEEVLGDWEVWVLPNGKPAIEVSYSIDFENGFKHYGHIDVILQNRFTKQLAVQENKTSGFKSVDEAIYANSSQALSYAVFLDAVSDNTSYEVFYNIYSSTEREWQCMPFSKSIALKAEWIKDVLLDHASIATYSKIGFYPKRGENCFQYMRRCAFFGTCNLTNNLPKERRLEEGIEAERVDYSFKVSELLANQKVRNEK